MPVPKTIALAGVDLSNNITGQDAEISPVACLLDDFEDAYRAYALDTASECGLNASDFIPEFVMRSWDLQANNKSADDGRSHSPSSHFDTIVLSCLGCDDSTLAANEISKVCIHLSSECADECRLYAIVTCKHRDAERALPLFDTVRQICEEAGFQWMGGVMVGGGALIPYFANAPRMGHVRHRVSEAVDNLIMAVRMGERAGEAQVRLGISRWAYRRLYNSKGISCD